MKTGRLPSVFECWEHKPYLIPKVQNKRKLNKNQIRSSETSCKHQRGDPSRTGNEIESAEVFIESSDTSEEKNFHKTHEEISELKAEVVTLREQVKTANNKIKQLEETLGGIEFCIENIEDKDICFYTGFPNREVYNAVLTYLNPGPSGENLVYTRTDSRPDIESTPLQKLGRPRKLSPSNQFFLFLCRVRVGLFECDLAFRFNISIGTVSNIVISWVNFLYLRLGSLSIWPSKETILATMPDSFKAKYKDTRVIIDCTEIKVEMPSSLVLKSQTYSNYKSANTLKGLVGISPSGSITFISQLYTGSISDREITERCGILKMPFQAGDSLMADKGFDIQDLLDPISVKLNMPPFLHMQDQMPVQDVLETQQIAAERIHVERAINKIKNFHLFDQVIPLSLAGSINQLWTVCGLLTLFQKPINS